MEVAKRYLGILSIVNDLGLTDRNIDVLSYLIFNEYDTKEMSTALGVSKNVVYNLVWKMQQMGLVDKNKNILDSLKANFTNLKILVNIGINR